MQIRETIGEIYPIFKPRRIPEEKGPVVGSNSRVSFGNVDTQ